ncbi:negative transcriptional regulator, PaiB family [Pseudorhodobacter antarcticus]|jgi:transcriptional regulator|uniref:Negative transcriptional regulator, PaiB family n=1 Tax=Pseudorhodobacter antarcticus TaxID=1077947 RepID=A0A1H8API3_9RHOB|nr:FMN-binding negative transcriptional regulator [Pseudorhodobacter antarcticus]SEM71728.1 negative transcriptional regulator, PaiB family [Pseudorhodobacter antarcticus]
MHPNPIFLDGAQADALAMVRARSFGILSVNGADGPLAAHIPFELGEGEVFLHLARSNPIARAALPAPALLAVSGPDAYVSPDWYGADDQVPTWNYIAVHLRGVLEPLPEAALRGHLARVSAHMEGQLAPKPAWTMEKMSHEAEVRMLRMILPFRLIVASVDSTLKLNQNKTVAQRAGAAQGIAAAPMGMEAVQIAAMMRARE